MNKRKQNNDLQLRLQLYDYGVLCDISTEQSIPLRLIKTKK